MNVTLALRADPANRSSDGKLNMPGTFNRIFLAKFPATHADMRLSSPVA